MCETVWIKRCSRQRRALGRPVLARARHLRDACRARPRHRHARGAGQRLPAVLGRAPDVRPRARGRRRRGKAWRPGDRLAVGRHALAEGAADRREPRRLCDRPRRPRFPRCDGAAHARAPARDRSGALADGAADRGPFDARRLVGAEAAAADPAPGRDFSRSADRHGHPRQRRAGLCGRAAAGEPPLLLHRRVHRHARRRAAGHRAGVGDVAAAAGDARRVRRRPASS